MFRHPFLTVPLFTVLTAANAWATIKFAAAPPPLFPESSFFTNLHFGHPAVFYAGSAFLSSLLGADSLAQATKLTRFTLLVFFLLFSITLPVLGILITAALALILRRPATGGVRPEERFVFGNPEAVTARRELRDPLPTLTPLAEGFRSMDGDRLCQAILGLKHLGPARALAPFLQRFQQDPRTSVQFTAQAVLGSATEALEETIRTLRQRLVLNPADAGTRFSLADTLDQLTAWTPPSDATTAVRRREATALVTEVLTANPDDARALRLLARLQLAAVHGPAAHVTATHLSRLDPAGDSAVQQILLESLFHQARWDDLAAAACLTPPAPGLAELHHFWTTTPQSLITNN